jgi:hypothetical protein
MACTSAELALGFVVALSHAVTAAPAAASAPSETPSAGLRTERTTREVAKLLTMPRILRRHGQASHQILGLD